MFIACGSTWSLGAAYVSDASVNQWTDRVGHVYCRTHLYQVLSNNQIRPNSDSTKLMEMFMPHKVISHMYPTWLKRALTLNLFLGYFFFFELGQNYRFLKKKFFMRSGECCHINLGKVWLTSVFPDCVPRQIGHPEHQWVSN